LEGKTLKLKTVALITLGVLVFRFVVGMGMDLDSISEFPAFYLVDAIGEFALFFFFFMLYRNAGER
jgi:hypothetical protein